MHARRHRSRSGNDVRHIATLLVAAALIVVGCTGGAASNESAPLGTSSAASAVPTAPDAAPEMSESEPSEPETSSPLAPSTPAPSTTLTDPCESLVESTTAVEIEGVERSFDLELPTALSPDNPAPLLVLLHGFGGQAAIIASRTNLLTSAPDAGVVLAVPQGVGEPTTWHYDASRDLGDAEFIDVLLDQLTESPCIDPDNIWLAGFSAGSGYTGIFGCSRAERFAGLLMVSGLAPPICPEKSGLEMMIFHGVEDPIVAFNGGDQPVEGGAVNLSSIPASSAAWAQQAGCQPRPTGGAYGAQNRSIVTTWGECAQGSTVRLVAIQGLGHTWPVSSPNAAPIVDASCAVLTAITDPALDPIASCFG